MKVAPQTLRRINRALDYMLLAIAVLALPLGAYMVVTGSVYIAIALFACSAFNVWIFGAR